MASIQSTTNVVMTGATGLVLLGFLVSPHWPPPPEVQAAAAAMLAPVAHLIGRGIYRRVEKWAGPEDADESAPQIAAAVPVALPGVSVAGKTS